MKKKKVISREYKIVLKSENFSGDASELRKKAQGFWTALENALKPKIKCDEGKLDSVERKREIRFYDTSDFLLQKSDYVFRERIYLDDGSREITLKFRHPDRYVSQDRKMEPGRNSKSKSKFEEDIKPPFLKLYSFSTTQVLSDRDEIGKIKHILKLFPGLKDHVNKKLKDESISLVHDFEIQETVITGASIIIDNDPSVNAECALIVWYDPKASNTNPLIVEFSFRYGNKKEAYTSSAAQNAFDAYMLIQESLKSWVGTYGTKTGFVYGNK